MAPFVSIITPMYNVEPYLAECVESVLAQSFGDWQLILVDDGSTDRSAEIARSYQQRYEGRIIFCAHPGGGNRGASAARNLGGSLATGEWIAYLDADDVWLPDRLAHHVDIVKAHPEVGLVVGATRYWYSWTGKPEDRDRDRMVSVGAPQDTVIHAPELIHLLYPLGAGAAPSMNSVLVQTRHVNGVGGWEDEFRTAYEDQVFLTKVYFRADAYVSSRCADLYRQRPGSLMTLYLSSQQSLSYIILRQRYLRWMEGYLHTEHPDEVQLLHQVRSHITSPVRLYVVFAARTAKKAGAVLRRFWQQARSTWILRNR